MRADDLVNVLHDEAIPELDASVRAAVDTPPAGVQPLTAAQRDWMLGVLAQATKESATHAISRVLGVIDGSTQTREYWGAFRLYYSDDEAPLSGDLQRHFQHRLHQSRR